MDKTRINSERRKFIIDENSDADELLNLVADKIYDRIEKLEQDKDFRIDYKKGLQQGEVNGMAKVLAWISALEKGRSI